MRKRREGEEEVRRGGEEEEWTGEKRKEEEAEKRRSGGATIRAEICFHIHIYGKITGLEFSVLSAVLWGVCMCVCL